MKKVSIKIKNKDGSTEVVQGYSFSQDVVPDQFAIYKSQPADPNQTGFFYHVTHLPSGACRAIKADTYKAAIAEFVAELQNNKTLYEQVLSSQKSIIPTQTSLF